MDVHVIYSEHRWTSLPGRRNLVLNGLSGPSGLRLGRGIKAYVMNPVRLTKLRAVQEQWAIDPVTVLGSFSIAKSGYLSSTSPRSCYSIYNYYCIRVLFLNLNVYQIHWLGAER